MRTLRLGMRGPDIGLMQNALARAGFYGGENDGVFGLGTYNAVSAFQRASGGNADGITGEKTWRALIPYLTGYQVVSARPGDTYTGLARRFGTTAAAIRTANPEIDENAIKIGSRIVVPLGFSVVPTDIYYTSDALVFVIRGLLARYPFLRAGSIGRSVSGKNLYYISIGTGDGEVMYNASHHANEWITSPVLLKFLEEYSAAYASGGKIYGTDAAKLYDKNIIYFVPMVNPDGVDLVNGAYPEDSPEFEYARSLDPSPDFPFDWKANIRGVDLNLNYPARWELAKSIKAAQGVTSPAPRDYVGPYPLSEPESSAMERFTDRHFFKLTMSYHTQGEVIYWKFAGYNPPRAYEIGQALSKSSGYALETTPDESANAGYKDWFIQTFNLPGYTIEAGHGENPLPLSQFDEIYRKNAGMLALAADLA